MSAIRAVFAFALSAVGVFTLVTASGCGTDANGIEDCRKIEKARCVAGKACGIVDDTDECETFYRDQCLHGLAVKSPGSPVVNRCVATIRAAGECAKGGPDAALASCPSVTESAPGVVKPCEIILNPEKTTECNFLTPATPIVTPEAGTAGAGGAGAGGTVGGAAGAESGGTGGIAGAESAGAGGIAGAESAGAGGAN
jgi:hypothetical protein